MYKIFLTVLLTCIMTVSFTGCGFLGATGEGDSEVSLETQKTSDSSNEKIVMEQPVTIINNEKVSVKVTQFFRELYNEGTADEFVWSGFEIEAENKMNKYDLSLYPRDCSLSDGQSIDFSVVGDSEVSPGQTSIIRFIRLDEADFNQLDSLYELEGNLDLSVRDNQFLYAKLGEKLAFSIPKAINNEAIVTESGEAEKEKQEAYSYVVNFLSGKTWLFNGGDDRILNYIDFNDDIAIIGQVYFDGNGIHDNGKNEYAYVISDKDITVTANGGDLIIPYSISGEKLSLGDGEYYSIDQVEKELQGYWMCKFTDESGYGHEYHLHVNHGKLRMECAAEAMGGQSGEYYYYGPFQGAYTLGIGNFDTTMRHGHEWFYNIIDGKPTILHYDTILKPGKGFPGENGYSF